MPHEQSLVDAARTVLEGHHGFQLQLPEQQGPYGQLADVVQQGLVGEVMLVSGAPGCGVTCLLATLAQNHPLHCMMLKSDLYNRQMNLVERVCDAVSMFRKTESYKDPPAWLLEYAKLTGLKYLILDDLDMFLGSARDIDRIMYEVSALGGERGGFTVIVSTRNMNLVRRFIKFDFPRMRHIWVGGMVAPSSLLALGTAFFNWNNYRLKLDIEWSRNLKMIDDDFDLQIDNVIKFLELSYVSTLLAQTSTASGDMVGNLNMEDLRYELQRILCQ